MRKKSMHVILMASVLVFSSIAGCLGNDDEKEEDSFTVIASTYHVAQLAEAVSGGLVDVEMMSTTNVPVHDYEPSPTDIIRLNEADVFLYHGLGLEPWVDGALADVENDNLIVAETHAVADGSQTLLFNEIMINTLCSDLSSLGTQDIHILHETMYFMEELHSDDAAYNMGMPDDHDDHDHDDHGDDDHDGHDHDDHGDDDHDDHGDDDHDDHDDHGDDDHDDHDGHDHGDHDGHDHGKLEKMEVEHTYSGNADCPADTTISVYELEAGEYVLEFESEEVETFKIAIAAMGGAHHHHHHGHGAGAFEWAGIFEMSDDTHTWSMQKVDGSYADQTMKLVLIPTDSTTEETMHSLESGVEALMEGDCTVVEDGETMSSISDGGSCFDLHVGSGDDSTFTMNTAGISGLAIYAQHVPIEFERNQHYLKDSTGEDIEPKAEEGADGHAHAHGDEDEGEMSGKVMLEMGDTNDDTMLDATEFLALMEMFEDEDGEDEDDHDHDHDHGDEDDHDEHGMSHEMEEAMWSLMFSVADMNADDMLEEDELNQLLRALEGDYFDNPAVNGELLMTFFDADEDGVLSLEEFEALMEMDSGEDDHDDHWEPNTCHDEDTHETHDEYTNEDDCEAAGYMWMDEDGHDDHDHDGHDEIEMMFNMTDANSDGSVDLEEMLGMMGEDGHEEGVAFIGFHVEEEGDYGFALPEGVKLHVLSMGGHEGHDHGAHGDDHNDHADDSGDDHADDNGDDHADHGDDHDDHDDHGDADALAADPHSWLDPVAYSAQVEIVYNTLSKAFPDNADAFRANADAYKAQLADLDDAFTAAFGENGTCQKNTVAANHNAYAYISYRYGIEFVNLHGLDPEGEPSPAAVTEVLERVEEDGVIAIYVEEYTPNGALDSLIQDTKSEDLKDGIQVLTLYTLEMAPADSSDNYITLMTKNLENLKIGLVC